MISLSLIWFNVCQVPAVGGAELAADPEVQEADGGTFSPAREARLLDGHHRRGHAGHHQQTAVSGTSIHSCSYKPEMLKHSCNKTCLHNISLTGVDPGADQGLPALVCVN